MLRFSCTSAYLNNFFFFQEVTVRSQTYCLQSKVFVLSLVMKEARAVSHEVKCPPSVIYLQESPQQTHATVALKTLGERLKIL